uniref:Uncharacterized protein n=1 Tax=Avena sativa TaxID=4498 RepID=A0ACD5Y2V2_AVESA
MRRNGRWTREPYPFSQFVFLSFQFRRWELVGSLPNGATHQTAITAPRRATDTQVAPLALRAPTRPVAIGGELACRPARAACILPRTLEMDAAEAELAMALLGIIAGERTSVHVENVEAALQDGYNLSAGSFSVHRHQPEKFLVFFATMEARNRVYSDEFLDAPNFRLLLRPWSRQIRAASGSLNVHMELEIEGVPAHAWSLAAAMEILAPAAWVERLHPLTRSRADMGVFRLTTWCLDPAAITRKVDLHIIEMDDPPSAMDMAAPASAVVPPHVPTMVHPLVVHIVRTVDFRRPTPGTTGDGSSRGGASPSLACPTT